MGKIWVEVSLISARGLRRSSLWKVQWFAVGWIDPKNKYCTRIDASGSSNPRWRTKFATLIDRSGPGMGDLALHIEVYSREPVFLRENLHGTATIFLKEFLMKHSRGESVSRKAIEEVKSYQLRKGNSKPQGFIDVAVRILEEGEAPGAYSGYGEGITLMDHNRAATFTKDEDSSDDDPASPRVPPAQHPIVHRTREIQTGTEFPLEPGTRISSPVPSAGWINPDHHRIPAKGEDSSEDSPPLRDPQARLPIIRRARENQTRTEFQHGQNERSNTNPSPGWINVNAFAGGASHRPSGGQLPRPRPSQTPPPPPPPSNVGFIPTFLPRTENPNLGGSYNYMNMPITAVTRGQSSTPGFEMGLGAGALAAGALIFGDDFLSGFDVPTGLQDAGGRRFSG